MRDKNYIINLLFRYNTAFWDDKTEGDRFCFSVPIKEGNIILEILDKTNRKVYSVREAGLFRLLKNRKNRIGLLIGIFIFGTLLILSSLFVWDIRIESDTDIPYNEILSNLKTVGCYKGRFIPTTDFDKVCIEYLDRYKNTAWISVNVKGSIAYVEIIDRDIFDRELCDNPQDIVAAYDATIVSISTYSGKIAVEEGMTVKKGDLLISGIITNANDSLRLCHADGVVMAIVYTDLSCFVPYRQTKMFQTGLEFEKKIFRFFNLEIPLKNNLPDNSEGYIVKNESNELVIFSDIELPLSVERTVYSEMKEKETVYSSAQAENAAQVLMKEKFETELKDAQILGITTNGYHSDEGYTLVCSVKCEMNIATGSEIIQ